MVAELNAAAAAASVEPVQPAAPSSVPDQSVELEERMMKMVAITVKQVLGEVLPHLQKPPQGSNKT
eukprot:1810172-Karenia_brevis.AAC.1